MTAENALFVFIFGTLMIVVFVFALLFFLIQYKHRQRTYITEKLQLKHQYQQQLLQSRLETQEQSFQYYSQEIHDNIGQALTICKLNLHELAAQTENAKAIELARGCTQILTQALTDLRNISHTLNGDYISRLGLKEALEKELQHINVTKKLQTTLHIEGEVLLLEAEKELFIFRIIQEAISNALKHAAARNINIMLLYKKEYLIVSIRDDGKGFDPLQLSHSSGIGLSNMQLRANLLSGSIHFDTAENAGTTITLQIPLPYDA